MTNVTFDIKEVGIIHEVRKAIVKIKGLPTCAYGQPLTFGSGVKGMVIGFDKQAVDALLFHEATGIKSGDRVTARAESLEMPVGNGFIGRVVNGLGEPMDGKEAIRPDALMPLFSEVPGIMERSSLTRPLYTGTKMVDAVTPIAKGQRQLIIGDRVTGKTTIAVDTILNQKDKNVLCIYCCIGRSYSVLLKLTQLLQQRGALDYTMIVASTADAPVGEQFMAPYVAACMGEYFMREGRDVLVVFDDLTKHAWGYREISLLMERSPGREAYPGDIFYVHSQLMERAAQLKPELGGGSMTFLPIVETQQGDVTGYISSNLISMTDGQIYVSNELFQEGSKPAIDLGLSVSRIGSKIQCPAMKLLCAPLRLEYVQYKELLGVTKMRANVSKEAQMKLRRGAALTELFKQNKNAPTDLVEQIVLFYSLKLAILDNLDADYIEVYKKNFYAYLGQHHSPFLRRLRAELTMTETLKRELDAFIHDYVTHYLKPPAAKEEMEAGEVMSAEETAE